ncbi:unnamed protein product [Blepharisma stoltei]|uniref:Uncharacterized protein n=1 Tax=Blepharisma stoltei TaxID=1481888 RepID=A0AAU9IHM9_9CILI|nr:unnamed protein product [Blepharisma stoltei]
MRKIKKLKKGMWLDSNRCIIKNLQHNLNFCLILRIKMEFIMEKQHSYGKNKNCKSGFSVKPMIALMWQCSNRCAIKNLQYNLDFSLILNLRWSPL